MRYSLYTIKCIHFKCTFPWVLMDWCILICIIWPPKYMQCFQYSKMFLFAPYPSTALAPGNQGLAFCHHRLNLSFLELHINGLLHRILFCIWLYLLGIMSLWFIHIIMGISGSFLLKHFLFWNILRVPGNCT